MKKERVDRVDRVAEERGSMDKSCKCQRMAVVMNG